MKGQINWDALGISASVACAIHCALFPLLINSLPILGGEWAHNPALEIVMIVLTLIIGVYSLWHGYRRHHHSFTPLLLFSIGFLFLCLKQWFPRHHIWMVILAVLFIVSAHFRNYRACRIHNHAHADDCNH
ncbi:MAG: MerC domain-containing protein [Chitinophagaceae bacterium]